MEYLELILELVPYVLSIIAIVAGFKKGKTPLTAEEIENKGEEKKQIYIAKQMRKIKTPSKVETVVIETTETTNQGIETLV